MTRLARCACLALLLCTSAVPAAAQPLVFSELMYDPASSESDWEWVEVYNDGPVPVDLTGWVLDDAAGTLGGANIAGGVVPPGGAALLYDAGLDAADFEAAWGAGLPLVPVSSWPSLNNGGDRLGLWASFADYGAKNWGAAAVDLTYDDAGGWPDNDGNASVYFAVGTAADPGDGASWSLSAAGTDGAVESTAAGGNSGADVGSPGTVPAVAVLVEGAAGTGNDDGFRMLAAPTTAAVRGDLADDVAFATGTGELAYAWTGTAWDGLAADADPLPSGRGFLLYLFDDDADPVDPALLLDWPGAAPTADVGVPGLAEADTWHLLGNPYAAGFDLAFLDLAAQGFQSTVQVWDPDADAYLPLVAGLDAAAAGQGFFVERTTAGAGGTVLTFDADGAAGGGALVGKGGASAARLGLTVQTADGRADAATLLFHPDADAGPDAFDAAKLPRPPGSDGPRLALVHDGDAHALLAVPRAPDAALEVALDVVPPADAPGGALRLSWPRWEAIPDAWRVTVTDARTGATADVQREDALAIDEGAGVRRLVLRIDPGSATAAGSDALPRAARLQANYPNPFRTRTTVPFVLPAAGSVRLAVYDVLGRAVAVLVDEALPAGPHRAVWDARGLPSGIYFARLDAGPHRLVHRLTLLK